MDLTGEIGLVRNLLTQMFESPLRVYCFGCKQYVEAEVSCPNEELDNDNRAARGQAPVNHTVKVRDNDHSEMVKATKLLSDIVKNHKEIQKGKEVTIRIEILNLVITKVVEAYEKANTISDTETRRRIFVESLDRLLLNTAQGPIAERVASSAK